MGNFIVTVFYCSLSSDRNPNAGWRCYLLLVTMTFMTPLVLFRGPYGPDGVLHRAGSDDVSARAVCVCSSTHSIFDRSHLVTRDT